MNSDDELAEGWALVPLPDVCDLNPPKPKAAEFADDLPVTFVPMPAVDAELGAITNPSTRPFGEVRKGFTSFRDNDVILAKITPCMENGKAAVARGLTNGLGFGSTEFHVFRSNGSVLPDYLYHFIRQESFRRAAESEMTGSVGQKRVPAEFLEQVELPLPPLAEQRRIVVAVERLLGRVSAARDRLNRVPATLKRFRQAVLAAACSGRLTADWRDKIAGVSPSQLKVIWPQEEAPQKKRRAGRLWGGGEVPELTDEERESIPDNWIWVKVGALGNGIDEAVQVGPMSMQSRDFDETGVPVLNVGCIQWGWFDESKLDHMPVDKAEAFSRYRIKAGDILFTRSGTIGRCAVATPHENDYLMTFHLLRVRAAQNKTLSEYLCYVFQGARHIRRQMEEAAIGSTRAGFNTSLLAGLDVPVPSIPEQREIIRRVGELFAVADAVEAKLAAARRRVEGLTQAVLAKAFRGELVPTEAELARRDGRPYEPASALLDRIRADRAKADPPKPRARSRR